MIRPAVAALPARGRLVKVVAVENGEVPECSQCLQEVRLPLSFGSQSLQDRRALGRGGCGDPGGEVLGHHQFLVRTQEILDEALDIEPVVTPIAALPQTEV